MPNKRGLEDSSDRLHQKGHDAYTAGATKTSDKMLSLSQKQYDKAMRRGEGINKAADKLAKEEAEQIDEVGDTPAGKRALGRYIKDRRGTILGAGMGMQQQNTDRSTTDKQRKDLGRRASNAFIGVSRAVDRLTKEEAEIDEKVKNPYAVGMAAAMKATGDKPPLKKSTIIKGHEIAKGIEAKEEAELHESTMSSSDAHKLSDRHVAAAIFHKKNGNMAAYRAHADHANDITDAILRAGRDMPIRSSRLKTKSDKIFNTHPHKTVSEEVEDLEEKGLWDNIHAKRERIKRGSGERMRKPGSKGAPTDADFRAAQHEETELQEGPRGESPTAGTRLVSKHQGKDGHHAEVRYNPDWQEYQVHHYHNGKHMGEGPVSYHGEGREGKKEATETAEHATKNFHVKNGKLHMNEHNNVDEGFTIRSKGYGNVQVVKGGKVIKTFTNPQDARMHIAKINKMLKKD